MGPTWERRQHGPVEVPSRQVVDTAGGIGAPYRSLDWLDLMARRGTITKEMRAAGDRFAADFHHAQYGSLRAVRLDRLRTGPNERAPSDPAESALDARRRVAAAQRALGGLGSPCERAIWHVLGFGRTIAEWCRAEGGWLRQETAKGILVGALGVLASHYGLECRDEAGTARLGATERGKPGRRAAFSRTLTKEPYPNAAK